MAQIEITWKKFESFKDLLMEKKHFWPIKNENPDHYWKPGLYLHTINHETYGELVDYVGKVAQSRLIERQLEHYRNIRAGICGVASELVLLFDFEKTYEKNFGNNDFYCGLEKNQKGELVDPKTSKYFEVLFDEEITLKLATVFFEYANAITVYIGVLDTVNDKQSINSSEKKLIWQLKPVRNWSIPKEDNGANIQHKGDIDNNTMKIFSENNERFERNRQDNNNGFFKKKRKI